VNAWMDMMICPICGKSIIAEGDSTVVKSLLATNDEKGKLVIYHLDCYIPEEEKMIIKLELSEEEIVQIDNCLRRHAILVSKNIYNITWQDKIFAKIINEIKKEKKDVIPESILTGRIHCCRCGASVSSPVPENTIVRAWVECEQCIEKGD
jgi:hypothetical protein